MKNAIINNNFDAKTKYQKYSHYLLPIAIEPLKYGKIIEQFGNKYIIQLTTSNVLVIKVVDNTNFIRFFRKGDLMIEFTDSKVSENTFTRTINDQRFTFEKNKLTTTEILSGLDWITIFSIYEDTDSITLTPCHKSSLTNWIEDSTFFKKYSAELFISFKLFLIFLVYVVFFIIFPEVDNTNLSLTMFSKGNIIKLRRVKSKHKWEDLVIKINNRVFKKIY